MTTEEFDRLLPTGAIPLAVDVVLESCGETRESVGVYALERLAEVQRCAMLAALFGGRTPFVIRDPRDNPRKGDVLSMSGAIAVVMAVTRESATVCVEDDQGNEVEHTPTKEEFRERFASWQVETVAATDNPYSFPAPK